MATDAWLPIATDRTNYTSTISTQQHNESPQTTQAQKLKKKTQDNNTKQNHAKKERISRIEN